MRKRNPENIGLPARWRRYHGAYYYQVPNGLEHKWDGKKQYRLGKTLSEAYREYANRISIHSDPQTMAQLLDRYLSTIVIEKAPSTQRSNRISIRRLRGFFGNNLISLIRPKHIYKFRDTCTERHGSVSANRDLEVLSHCFTKAIEWGAIDSHPMSGKKVVKNRSQKRDRYVEDWEVEQFLLSASPFLRSYVEVKLILGLRKGDMLSLRLEDITDEGVLVKPRKTARTSGRSTLFLWSDELRSAVRKALMIRPKPASDYLFCTRTGGPYVNDEGACSGFDSIWQRAMRKALRDSKLTSRFTEHDLRAKVASDTPLHHAQQLMGHTDARITQRVYRRKPNEVTPAK